MPPHQYEAIGSGNATHTLVELRVAETLPAGEPSAYPFVARVEPADGRACSGALIAPQWIATTRTCLDPAGNVASGAPPQAATVVLNRPDLNRSGGHTATIAEVVPRTDRDLVLARLSAPAEGIAPIRLTSFAPASGDQVLAAGYGRGATDWTADRLRTGTYTVGAVTGTALTLSRSAGTATSTCKGDAGGPAFQNALGHYELLALHHRSGHAGCFGAGDTAADEAVEVRTDDITEWITTVVTPPAARNPLRNLLAGATPTASTTIENWGWALRQINDGTREGIGWTSADPPNPQRIEWLQFDLPQPQRMNRVDLFPRSDATAGGFNFPADLVIETYRDGSWFPALVRNNVPNLGTTAQRFSFGSPRTVEKLRIGFGSGRLIQLAEVEAYLSDNQLADAVVTAASNLENWGWSLRYANDGVSDGIGYSSADPHAADRREWIAFAFPGPRTLNQLELYPRADGANAGMSFPANFTVEAWRDGQWHTVLTRTDHPNPGAAPQRYLFPAQTAERLRITADAGRFLQLAEVAAHHI